MAFAEPLTDDEIERRLSELDGWPRTGVMPALHTASAAVLQHVHEPAVV